MNMMKRILVMLIAVVSLAAAPMTIVYADTDGKEIQITDQPDKLVLQLGPQWAGVEFELKTDAGVFPVPVVVDQTGILKMDLGGSKTYILSCLASTVALPGPDTATETQPPAPPSATPSSDGSVESGAVQVKDGIPTGIVVMFILGLAVAVGGLLTMRYFKRRRESYHYDDDDDGYDE